MKEQGLQPMTIPVNGFLATSELFFLQSVLCFYWLAWLVMIRNARFSQPRLETFYVCLDLFQSTDLPN